MFWIEAVATLFGFACVILTIRQNIWCWPTGLVQVLLYCVVFWSVRLYSDLLLHGIYVGLQLYGWHHWLHGGLGETELPVTRLTGGAVVACIGVTVLGSLAVGSFMATYTDAALPYADAPILVASLVAQWLLTRKRLESWHFWIVVDVVAVAVYFSRSLFFTTGLYLVFLFLAIAGLLTWKRSFSQSLMLRGADEGWSHAG